MNDFQPVDRATLCATQGRYIALADFLGMFGVRVRNYDNVPRITEALADAGLTTVPSFTTCRGDTELHIVKAGPQAPEPDELDEVPPGTLPQRAIQVGDLPSARAGVDSVPMGTDLASATYLMREKGYSQLPVIDGLSNLRGVLTWSSIAVAYETGAARTLAKAMVKDSLPVAEVHQHLFAHLPAITDHGYLLVRHNNGTFSGIVTAVDITERFKTTAQPFFLVGEIESRLRMCLGTLDSAAISAVQQRGKQTGVISDLMFGQYQRLVSDEANWRAIGWTGMPHAQFVASVDRVRKIRNAIAHFHPEPLTPAQLAILEEFAGLLRQYVP